MGSEQLCLSWNDFERNFSVAFQDLRKENDFFDVTLACKDGQLEAHKVILSSCSTFFKEILKKNKHTHPLIYMKDVKLSQLQAITDFMYQGRVNVEQKELDAFLALARELQIKGLIENESVEEYQVEEKNSVEKKKMENQLDLRQHLKLRKPEDLFKPITQAVLTRNRLVAASCLSHQGTRSPHTRRRRSWASLTPPPTLQSCSPCWSPKRGQVHILAQNQIKLYCTKFTRRSIPYALHVSNE